MTRSEDPPRTTGFGEYLRREREMRGVSLEEITTATRISIRFLQAIENEELSKLPGGIFTRSFVRTYARYLGFGRRARARGLPACRQAKVGNRYPPHYGRQQQGSHQASPPFGHGPSGLLVAGVLLAGGYVLFHHSRRIIEQRSSAPLVLPPGAPLHPPRQSRRGKGQAAQTHLQLSVPRLVRKQSNI